MISDYGKKVKNDVAEILLISEELVNETPSFSIRSDNEREKRIAVLAVAKIVSEHYQSE